jgi:hypothetical protein
MTKFFFYALPLLQISTALWADGSKHYGLLSQCIDGTDSIQTPALCAGGSMDSDIGIGTEINSPANNFMLLTEPTVIASLTSWIAVHTQYKLRYVESLTDESLEKSKEARFEEALIAIGDPTSHRIRVNLGKQAHAFGIGRSTNLLSPTLLRSDIWWKESGYGAIVTIDDLRTWMIQFGYLSEEFKQTYKRSKTTSTGSKLRSWNNNDTVMARLMIDPGLLHKTRIFSSFSAQGHNTRRVGFGILNESFKGDFSRIEWARIRIVEEGITEHTVFYASFESSWFDQFRLAAEYNDESHSHRMFTLIPMIQMGDHLLFVLTAGFYKTENNVYKNHAVLSGGMRANF